MKRLFIFCVLAAASAMNLAAINIRITGYGGQDPAVVTRLLNDVIGKDLKAQNISVIYEPVEGDYNASLYNALSAGTAGDLVYIPIETAPGIIATGKILPLDGRVDLKPFLPSLIDAYRIDGKVYGIAKDFNTLALFYNKDLFDEAKVAYPNENDTWDSLEQKAKKIKTLGSDYYAFSFPADYARFGGLAFGNGWKPFDAQGKTNLSDPKFVKAVEWYTGLVKSKLAILPADLGQGWGGGAFATEKVAMTWEGAWIVSFLRNEAPNLSYGVTFLPKAAGADRGNFIYTVAYGVNADSKNREAALKVLQALTSEKAQQFVLEQGLAIPSRSSLANNPYFKKPGVESLANRIVFEGASNGKVEAYAFRKVGTDWMRPVNAMLAAIMTGGDTVQEAIQTAQKEMNTLLARAGK